MLLTSYIKIKLIFVWGVISELFWCIFQSFWYINKVYRPLLNCGNLPMMHNCPCGQRTDGERGNKWSILLFLPGFRQCMVAIRDACNCFQSILVNGNIVAYFHFLKKIDLWRAYAPFGDLLEAGQASQGDFFQLEKDF